MQPAALLEAHAAARIPAQKFLEFVKRSVTPFHAVAVMKERLTARGFVSLDEKAGNWSLSVMPAGGRYFVTRNDSSIIAFEIGSKVAEKAAATGAMGLKIVGAHTDSPNLQLKPKTFAQRGNFLDVAVQLYGGGLWHTWFDRELTVAGRVVVQKTGETALTTRLVHIDRPIMRIPTLAIHLQSAEEREKFAPNKENHVAPVICTKELAKAMGLGERAAGDHNSVLMKLLSEAAGCDGSEIVDFDLSVIDTQPPAIGGAFEEFIHSPRIDNLLSCYCCLEAMLESTGADDDDMIRVFAAFDDEEVGSETAHGAASSLIVDVIERIATAFKTTKPVIAANSFLFSVDCAHAAHPHYLDKHEAEHRPNLHEGPVIKFNANHRYATNGPTAAVVKALAKIAGVPVQSFCVKNDSPCGSTIGPIMSTLTGIRSVDIGNPMLSMHSVRETCGTVDVLYMIKLVTAFYEKFQSVDPQALSATPLA